VKKCLVILTLCQIIFPLAPLSFAEDYSECRTRCESEHTDCMNEPAADDPEVQNAKMAACDQKLLSCYPDCDQLKPLEDEYEGTENNPNIIRKIGSGATTIMKLDNSHQAPAAHHEP